jgi:hypothetical protein
MVQPNAALVSASRSKLNRRNRRKFEQKAAKETKTDVDWVSVMVIR